MKKLVAIALLVLAGCGGGGGGNPPPTVATPVLSPAAGTYAAVQNVTTTTTVKAMATLAGQNDSAVATAIYVLKAATPVISPAAGTFATAQQVTITSATPGAAIHYTTDGAAPTAASPTFVDPIPLPLGEVAATTTVKAVALATGFQDSAVASSTFTIDPAATTAATPTFSVPAGTYTAAQSVTISTTTVGASVYYTKDGSTPTTASTLYATPVTVDTSLTLKAIAAGGGHLASPVASAAYVINLPQVATPTFSPGPGSYSSPQTVTIATATAGATIYFTADGTTPTIASTLYTVPVLVDASKTLKAIATKAGSLPSAVGSAAYVIGGGGTPFVTLCNGLFAKMTSLFETCLQANPAFVPSLIGASSDFCADRQLEIDAGKISYDPVAGAACDAAIQALDCGAISGDSGLRVPSTCDASLVGQVATGGQCFDSADCANGWCGWDLAAGTCPDTCRPFAQLNQPCNGPDCAPGLECDGTTGSFICSAPAALGGPCPCQEGLWCDRTVLPNTCRGFLPAGASCIPNGDPCTILTTCAGTPATCKPWLAAGATCDPADLQCGLGYECSATGSTCVSWPTLGQACEGFCLGSWCDIDSICKAQKADGATCIPFLNGDDCLSGSCNFTTSRCEASRCFMP